MPMRLSVPAAVVAAMAVLAGCGETNTYAPPPPAKVSVAQPLTQEVTDYLEFTGLTSSVASVEVRARVKGMLETMEFEPGTRVEAGDLMFVIDPREYEAELNAAKAELASAEAEQKRAEIELARAQRLFQQKAGSESDVVKWRGEAEIAKAAILRAQAKVEQAQLNLGYTQVTAPISGRVSRNLVDPGNLVGYGESTLLATVTDFTPMYAYFNMNERDLLEVLRIYRARRGEKDLKPDESYVEQARIPVFLGLADEEGYPHEGVVDYADPEVDPDTGTLQLRGVFTNASEPPELLPGLFVRLRMPIRKRQDALLVSERAVGSDQGGTYVLVVNDENVVEKQPIVRGQVIDGLVVIEEGVRPGDRVVVTGVQRARTGAEVNPTEVDMSTLTTSARRAAAEKQPANEASSDSDKGSDAASAAP